MDGIDPSQPAIGVYLVEHYAPGMGDWRLRDLTGRVAAAARSLRLEGRPVDLLWSGGVPDDELLLVFLSAPSGEDAREVIELAGLHADRIVAACVHHPAGNQA